MIATEAIRLNLGCRTRSMPGWKNLDCDPHDGVDIVGDIRDLSMFADGSVSEIYASHVAEHVPHPETLSLFKEWARVLAPGGILYVAVPDFKRTVEIYLRDGLGQWVQDYVSGGQEYKTAHHYAIFDFPRLRGLLLSAGFSEASQVEKFPIGDKRDCSNAVSTLDMKPVSLNVVAVK